MLRAGEKLEVVALAISVYPWLLMLGYYWGGANLALSTAMLTGCAKPECGKATGVMMVAGLISQLCMVFIVGGLALQH
jgi:hypothetical protein